MFKLSSKKPKTGQVVVGLYEEDGGITSSRVLTYDDNSEGTWRTVEGQSIGHAPDYWIPATIPKVKVVSKK